MLHLGEFCSLGARIRSRGRISAYILRGLLPCPLPVRLPVRSSLGQELRVRNLPVGRVAMWLLTDIISLSRLWRSSQRITCKVGKNSEPDHRP